MSSTRREPKQQKLQFPTRKNSSNSLQFSKTGATKKEAEKSKTQATRTLTESEARAQAADARAKSQTVTKAKPTPAKKTPKPVVKQDSDSSSEEEDEFRGEASDADDRDEPAELPADEAKEVGKPDVVIVTESSEDEAPSVSKGKNKAIDPKGMKELVKEKEFKDHYKEVKAELGGKLTDSAKKESKATTILRRFDLNYDYGASVGIPREERWKRAEDLGLNPPKIVWEILQTRKVDKLSNEEVEALEQSVFHGLV